VAAVGLPGLRSGLALALAATAPGTVGTGGAIMTDQPLVRAATITCSADAWRHADGALRPLMWHALRRKIQAVNNGALPPDAPEVQTIMFGRFLGDPPTVWATRQEEATVVVLVLEVALPAAPIGLTP
jgi:hypothetical protein